MAFVSPKRAFLTYFALIIALMIELMWQMAFSLPKELFFFAQSGLQLPKPDPVRPPIRLTDEDIGEVVSDRLE